jgi:hypothetical protein
MKAWGGVPLSTESRAELESLEQNWMSDTTRLRSVIKKDLLSRGLKNFFVLDGVGALLGVAPGGNRGPVSESLADLENIVADDNVHYTELGYKNLGTVMLQAIAGVAEGSLTKSIQPHTSAPAGAGTGTVAPQNKNSFFWRCFSSPVGISGTRHPQQQLQQLSHHSHHPRSAWRDGSGSRAGRGFGGGGRGRGNFRGQKGHRNHPYWNR